MDNERLSKLEDAIRHALRPVSNDDNIEITIEHSLTYLDENDERHQVKQVPTGYDETVSPIGNGATLKVRRPRYDKPPD